MEQVIKLSIGMVGTFNFVMNMLRLLKFGKEAKKRKVAYRAANAGIEKTCTANATLRKLHFYTNYNDLLVSSTKGI